MNWQDKANATEARLHRQLLDGLAGDARAYHGFLDALGKHLRGYLRRRLTQLPDEVEDLVQETLLAVHTHRHTYQPALPLTAWVHTIARYKLIDFLRARSRHDALNDPIEEDLVVFAHPDTDAADAKRDLETLLQTLPARQRAALRMTKIDGASVAETAAALDMSQVAVKVSVHRSLKTLAARFRGPA